MESFLNLTRIGFPTRPQAFQLVGRAVMTLPEDRIYDDAEQVVLSTTHLRSLLDEFVFRQPTRRKMKVTSESGLSSFPFESSWLLSGRVAFLPRSVSRGTPGHVSNAFVYSAGRRGHTLMGDGTLSAPPAAPAAAAFVCPR